jgi:RNA polymerase sigma-70 factor (ECF subfamily)
VGTWLPEPLVGDAEADAASHTEMAESLSMAFLVLLESLAPVERAAIRSVANPDKLHHLEPHE